MTLNHSQKMLGAGKQGTERPLLESPGHRDKLPISSNLESPQHNARICNGWKELGNTTVPDLDAGE